MTSATTKMYAEGGCEVYAEGQVVALADYLHREIMEALNKNADSNGLVAVAQVQSPLRRACHRTVGKCLLNMHVLVTRMPSDQPPAQPPAQTPTDDTDSIDLNDH